MSDDEVVDPKVAIEEKCTNGSTCGKLLVEYERCAKRIENKPGGECSGQYMDFVACVDNCVSRRAAHEASWECAHFAKDRVSPAHAAAVPQLP